MMLKDSARLRLAVRLLRVVARLLGVSGKEFDAKVAEFDAMSEDERERAYQANIEKAYAASLNDKRRREAKKEG